MPEHLRRFEGQSVLVTGASRGIGEGIARRFAKEGAQVAVSANVPDIEDTAARIAHQSGATVIGLPCDVTDRTAVETLVDTVAERFGRLDVSVQNAGIITVRPIDQLTEADWDRTLDVNTKGVFLCCQAAARHMIRQNYGRLINTASAQARQGFIYTPHYAASKFGVMGVTQALSRELARHNITVNAFCPGIIETDMWDHLDGAWGTLLGDYKPGELMAEWVGNIPLKRAGTADDVSGLVAFLASKDAAYITGQTINVDGGMVMS